VLIHILNDVISGFTQRARFKRQTSLGHGDIAVGAGFPDQADNFPDGPI
jgi:hypothetical protein